MLTFLSFQKQFEASRPLEDAAIAKALEHFNKTSPDKPYRIIRRPDKTNYRVYKYDAEISNDDQTIKIEAKADLRSAETGNFFVEYYAYGKPSGISITDADYYVIDDAVDLYMITVTKLNRIIQRYDEVGKLKHVEFKSPDGLITKGYLLKKAVVAKFATKL